MHKVKVLKKIRRIPKALTILKVSKSAIFNFIALLCIYIVGLLLRLEPLLVYGPNLRAYDTFIQYYSAKRIVEKGLLTFLNAYDPQRWWPWGILDGKSLFIGIPITGAYLYLFLRALGFEIDLLTVCCAVPALFGSFVPLIIYGIAKEFKSDKAGLIAAFLTAIGPGAIQRTIAGFYDNESVGLFLMMFSLYFFVRAIKRKSVKSAFLSGVFLGFLGLTWGVYRFILDLFALYISLLVISRKLSIDDSIIYSTTTLIGIGLMLLAPRNYRIILKFEVFAALVLAILCILFMLSYYLELLGIKGATKKVFGTAIGIGAIITIALVIAGFISPTTGKWLSTINPLARQEMVTFISVSENQPSPWTTLWISIGAPILFSGVAVYYAIERHTKEDLLLILIAITSFYFCASINRFVVVAAPLFAVLSGIGMDAFLDPFGRMIRGEWIIHHVKPVRRALGEYLIPRKEAALAYILIFLVLLFAVDHVVFTTKGLASYDVDKDELQVYTWLKMYDPGATVLAWWDYGYRLRVYGNATTLADNGTGNSTQMGVVGTMLMLPPSESIYLMAKYNVKYVAVWRVDIAKAVWMIRIASKHYPVGGVNESKWYDSERRRYKEPFFHSVLWTLLAYGETDIQIRRWVQDYGVPELKDMWSKFRIGKENLIYFEPIKSSGNVKLYKVIYRTNPFDVPPESPKPSYPPTNVTTNTSTTNTSTALFNTIKANIHIRIPVPMIATQITSEITTKKE